jgi:hypothetical protein
MRRLVRAAHQAEFFYRSRRRFDVNSVYPNGRRAEKAQFLRERGIFNGYLGHVRDDAFFIECGAHIRHSGVSIRALAKREQLNV